MSLSDAQRIATVVSQNSSDPAKVPHMLLDLARAIHQLADTIESQQTEVASLSGALLKARDRIAALELLAKVKRTP